MNALDIEEFSGLLHDPAWGPASNLARQRAFWYLKPGMFKQLIILSPGWMLLKYNMAMVKQLRVQPEEQRTLTLSVAFRVEDRKLGTIESSHMAL